MTTFLLIRHAQNEWVRTGRLAGWTPEVHLNETGQQQAAKLGERLADANLTAIYSSPLVRAVETAEAVAQHHPDLEIQIEEGVGEVDFGDWQGEELRQLRRRRLWQGVQQYPSGTRFPGGETFLEMQFRLVSTLEGIADDHRRKGLIAVFAHSDVIKSVVAHYAGIHLDLFQRLTISPASMSVIHLHRMGPRIIRINDTAHYSLDKRDES